MKYSDMPFEIVNCKNCDMEIPDPQILCDICAENGRQEDVEKLRLREQKRLWKLYIYNKGLSTCGVFKK